MSCTGSHGPLTAPNQIPIWFNTSVSKKNLLCQVVSFHKQKRPEIRPFLYFGIYLFISFYVLFPNNLPANDYQNLMFAHRGYLIISFVMGLLSLHLR